MENYFRRDWTELLSVFNAHGIDYMLVGGQAMAFLVEPRTTKDLDLFVAPTAENLEDVKILQLARDQSRER